MTIADYKPFVERMIQRYEGGYGWDRNDPGGPTKYGITCYDLAEFLHRKMDSMANWAPIVQGMSLTIADQIYEQKYATACDFDDLNTGKDCVVFDFGVNSGPSRSIKIAQKLCGVVVDGVLGPLTLTAINAYDPDAFINDLCDARLRFLRQLAIWPHFKNGWSARVADLHAYSLNLVSPVVSRAHKLYVKKPVLIPFAYGKAYAPDDLPGQVH